MLYRDCVCAGDICFTSGQLPIIKDSTEFPSDFNGQARQSLMNLFEVVKNNGGCKNSIIKINIFLSDINNFDEFNNIYIELLSDVEKPARTCLQVACLPRKALIEVEAVFTKCIK